MIALLLTLACTSDGGADDRPPRPNRDDSATDDSGGGGPGADEDFKTEGDEDEDGLADCEDDDCGHIFECTWPEDINHEFSASFKGQEITCKFGSSKIPVDVPDCATTFTSPMAMVEDADICADCQRTYDGPTSITGDSCTEITGSAPPASVRYGMKFKSETERGLYAKDATNGQWDRVGDLVNKGPGVFQFTTTEEVTADPADCNNGPQKLGMLTVTLTFSDQ